MKKKKVIACILAATATLAMASMGAGCAVKDWFEEKLNDKDSQQSESVVDSSEEEKDVVCEKHLDANYDKSCDVCEIAVEYVETAIIDGEKAMGNWYRFYNTSTEGAGPCGRGDFSNGEYTFFFNFNEEDYYDFGLQSYCKEGVCAMPTVVDGVFEFYKHGEYSPELNINNSYFDVYIEPGKTFTIKRCIRENETDDVSFEDVTFTIDENITVSVPSSAKEYSYRLNVVAADSVNNT